MLIPHIQQYLQASLFSLSYFYVYKPWEVGVCQIFVRLPFKLSSFNYFFSRLQNFLVDIKGPSLAFLPVLAFEGGTRRNIPKFEVCIIFYIILLFSLYDLSIQLLLSSFFRSFILCQFMYYPREVLLECVFFPFLLGPSGGAGSG